MSRVEAVSLLGGIALAVAALLAANVWLLSIDGHGFRVLVAVWLWALPVLGVGAIFGWLTGRALRLVTK
jgi:hypothetical protein